MDFRIKLLSGVMLLLIACTDKTEQSSLPSQQEIKKSPTVTSVKNNLKIKAFFMAVSRGDRQGVQQFLDDGIDADTTLPDKTTALIIAAREGRADIVQLLLDKGANINAQNEVGISALFSAVTSQQSAIVELLLANNANINIQLDDGTSVLIQSVMWGYPELTSLLLKYSPDVNLLRRGKSALLHAIHKKQQHLALELIKLRADINVIPDDGRTALVESILHEMPVLTNLLLDMKVRLDEAAHPVINPLAEAIKKSPDNVIERLLLPGALSKKDERGFNPLHIAILNNRLLVVKLFVERGASIEDEAPNGESPFLIASHHGNFDIARWLIEKGANVNAMNDYGNTPLYGAVMQQQYEWASYLVENGADPELPTARGDTALDLADEMQDGKMLEILLSQR